MKTLLKHARKLVATLKKDVHAFFSLAQHGRSCKACATLYDPTEWDHLRGEDRRLIIDEGFCYDCSYWVSQHRHKEESDCLVVEKDGVRTHYRAHPFMHGGGFGGCLWMYQFNGLIRSTRNMWHQGDIPEHLHYMFPVNARFLPLPEYNFKYLMEKDGHSIIDNDDAPF